MAAASPSHPGYPHPPQLFPGSSSLTAASVSFTSTDKNLPAIPKIIPINKPTPPTINTAKRTENKKRICCFFTTQVIFQATNYN